MTKSFVKLFEESLGNKQIRPGSIIPGTVISIFKDTVLVDVGLKSESFIPIEEFYDENGIIEVKIGDQVDVVLDTIENGYGETILSREKAKKHALWSKLKDIFEKSKKISGVINGRVKGGFTVEINGIRAFLPGSLVDVYPVKDSYHLEGKEFDFKVIKLDQKRNNVVVSRKAVIEMEYSNERDTILNNIKEGTLIKGIVKNLTDYGAFIDLRGIDGLLHITDMTWKRIKHPNEILNIGDEISVKILKFDRERNRVSLGLKQLSEDPWKNISNYHQGSRVTGRVTNLTDYGCFVEIEPGIEGLVHISEMDWTKKNIHPSKFVKINDIIEVVILNIDESKRRISLGMKQCKTNPWKEFASVYSKGDKISGKIKSITDFGIFIGLQNNIDGLVHISDITWNEDVSEVINKYKKNDILDTVLLQVDIERERISLGIKQLDNGLFNTYINKKNLGDIVKGKIIKINNNTLIIELERGIIGNLFIKNHLYSYFKVGDEISTKILSFDHKNKVIVLSYLENKAQNSNVTSKDILNKKVNDKLSNVMTEAFKAATKNEDL